MTDEDRPRLVGVLKELLDDQELRRVTASYSTGPDSWRTVTVREASILETTDDGLTVEIEDGSL